MKKAIIFLVFIITAQLTGFSKNPIVANKGVCDPHIHIFNGKAYCYATHDRSINSKGFFMDDWWIWSSSDLVNWKLESYIKPEDTYLKRPFEQCWATDAVTKNGKYYFYFSEANQQTGVLVSDSPAGPWKDPLGKPLLDSVLTPTHEYDMSVLIDDDGTPYLLFGVWDYYLVRLNEDMISMAELPRKVIINNPVGPYGKGKTDDKPNLHKYNGKFYLSWGCFYAMSENIYGPYDYKGSVLSASSFAPGYEKPTWPMGFLQGRHGNFFEWNNQWYFTYCDISQTGNRYFRDSFISYVHYKDNGEMATIRVDGTGVGEYDASQPVIEAEDYFISSGIRKTGLANGGFAVDAIENNDFLIFPNIKGLKNKTKIEFRVLKSKSSIIEIRSKSNDGILLAKCKIAGKKTGGNFENISVSITDPGDTQSLCFVFKGEGKELFKLDSFSIK